MKNVIAFSFGLLASIFAGLASAVDYTAANTAISATVTDAAATMAAVIGVAAAFWGFHKVKSLLGR